MASNNPDTLHSTVPPKRASLCLTCNNTRTVPWRCPRCNIVAFDLVDCTQCNKAGTVKKEAGKTAECDKCLGMGVVPGTCKCRACGTQSRLDASLTLACPVCAANKPEHARKRTFSA
jgi:hypothetical protein